MMICLTTSVGALRLSGISEVLLQAKSATRAQSSKEGDLLNEALVDSHLKGIPGLGALTAGGLAGGDLKGLGWEADWALDTEVLGLGAVNELSADFLKRGNFAGGEGDSNFMGFL